MIMMFVWGVCKGILFSVLLCVGCFFLGRSISRYFCYTVWHILLMACVTVVSCVLITSYSITSSTHSSIERLGGGAISALTSSESLVGTVSNTLQSGNPLKGLNEVRNMLDNDLLGLLPEVNIEELLGDDFLKEATSGSFIGTAQETGQFVNRIAQGYLDDVLNYLSRLKMKLFIAILILQLLQNGVVAYGAYTAKPPYAKRNYMD